MSAHAANRSAEDASRRAGSPAGAPAPGRASRWPAAWRHWYLRVFPAYLIFLFCSTHFPHLTIPRNLPQSDKLSHCVAFGLLAFVFWRFVEACGRGQSRLFVWKAAVVLIGYAALDEMTQGLVDRGVDFFDWLADSIGIAIALAVLEWRRRIAG